MNLVRNGKKLQSNETVAHHAVCRRVIDWKTEDTFVIFLQTFESETVYVHSIYVSDKKIKNVTVTAASLRCRSGEEWIASSGIIHNAHARKTDVRRQKREEEKNENEPEAEKWNGTTRDAGTLCLAPALVRRPHHFITAINSFRFLFSLCCREQQQSQSLLSSSQVRFFCSRVHMHIHRCEYDYCKNRNERRRRCRSLLILYTHSLYYVQLTINGLSFSHFLR